MSGYRKLIFAGSALAALSALVAVGAISDATYRDVAVAIIGGFFAGNWAEHRERRKAVLEATIPTLDPVSRVS